MKKILIVEDELVIAMSASLTLEQEGYAVVLASNGRNGLEKAREEAPDLIITDHMMPKMDGIAMAKALRQDGVKTPILLASAIPAAKLDADGAYDAYLGKPFREADLLRAVRDLLGEPGRDG